LGWLTVDWCGVGVSITGGSSADLPYLSVNKSRLDGVYVAESSYLRSPHSLSKGNEGNGYQVTKGSFADLEESEARDNVRGYILSYHSGAYAPLATADSNDLDGFSVVDLSYLQAEGATATGTGSYGFSIEGLSYANLDSSNVSLANKAYNQSYLGYVRVNNPVGDTSISSPDPDTNDITDFIKGL
jgi:hypothetical protein